MWVYNSAMKAGFDRVIVATDDQRMGMVKKHGGEIRDDCFDHARVQTVFTRLSASEMHSYREPSG